MSYSTSLPGIDEAVRDALVTLITNSLTDLNTALARDALTPMTWASSQILLGDPEIKTGSCICVVGGGETDGTDLEGGIIMASGMAYTVYSHIIVYISGKEFITAGFTLAQEAAARERARSRTTDHLRARLLNDPANWTITLASQEFRASPSYDALLRCHVSRVIKGIEYSGPGGDQAFWYANLLHRGEIK